MHFARSAVVALRSSRALAINTVQVTSEAISRPIITSFTIQSAWRNMPPTERLAGITGATGLASAATGTIKAAIAAPTPARRCTNFSVTIRLPVPLRLRIARINCCGRFANSGR